MKKTFAALALFASFVFLGSCSPPRPLETPTALAPSTALPTETESPTPDPTTTDVPTPTPPQPGGTVTPIVYERSPRAILIEADLSPNATTPRDAHVVTFRLYGDGLVVLAGDQAPLASGLDATVRVGHLSESEIQSLVTFISQSGFFNLNPVYQPRPLAPDAPMARISVYLNRAKTVRVYAPDADTTPQIFKDVFIRIRQTIPTDAQNFSPNDALLQAISAVSVSDLRQSETIGDWSNVNVRLSDALDGITVSGNAYTQIAGLVARKFTNGLYREGDRVYRVRFAPNVPRAPHLTDWVSVILDAPREFDGRVFEIVGYYRGANLFGEVRDNAPNARNAWVISDASGSMYVAGIAPSGLNPNSRTDAWTVVRVRGVVTYVRLGTSYLHALRVSAGSSVPPSSPPPSPSPVSPSVRNADAAIALVKSQFAQVAKIQKTGTGVIGASQNIFVFERADGWDLAFWEGSGDCPAGCINDHYYYFSVKKDGRVAKVGEYTRAYEWSTNSFDVTGAPMWGVPK